MVVVCVGGRERGRGGGDLSSKRVLFGIYKFKFKIVTRFCVISENEEKKLNECCDPCRG